jgi:protein-tyrosine phosphatase
MVFIVPSVPVARRDLDARAMPTAERTAYVPGSARNLRGAMIDLHCHVLPGIDDGPETMEGSIALAHAATAAGAHTLVATPHVSTRYPNDATTIARLVAALRERLSAEGVGLDLLPGAEIALTRLPDIEPDQLPRLGLGGGPWLLIECPFAPAIGGLDDILLGLTRRGRRVVLAHPERCATFQRDPQKLARLVDSGIVTSITAGSLVGHFGDGVRRFALELVRRDLVHNVTSDAHDHVRRPPSVLDELKRTGLAPLAGWLTCEVPAAILKGDEIPPRPRVALPALETERPRPPRRRFGRVP